MKENEQRAAAKAFAKKWQGKGYEKGETQPFWLSLLQDVFGVEHPADFIVFEEQVQLGHKSFIDATIPETHVMIEQKSLGKDLSKPIKQSDGTVLTPYQQAKRYAAELPYSKRPRWIVASNFAEFRIYDMENPQAEPEIVLLEHLEQEYYRLRFLVNSTSRNLKKEMELSLQAGEIVGRLYDALRQQYNNPDSEESLKHLNKLCVRIVFCLYSESAGIFGKRNMFREYLQGFRDKNIRKALIDLFEVLNTPVEERDPYMDAELAAFPYVNGGLFADSRTELQRQIPQLTGEILHLLLKDASEDFDWSGISPTIFGAVFESTLNPQTRRAGGMHYTSLENIHKVIDPLFLDDLKREFESIKETKVAKTRSQKLRGFQEKLAGLRFLDPAAGSGNFLTETYIALRRLENEVLKDLLGVEMTLGFDGEHNPIKVSIGQFYGIEINDFAVTVAKTALWIAESQMMAETENIVHFNLDFLPLKSYANIIEGNALRMDWEQVILKAECNYILGNPPFVGYSLQSKEQKADMLSVYVDENGKPYKKAGKIDYVAGWYFKAAEFMQGTSIHTAFVSTNSITQGEQVADIWQPLYDRFGIHIDFAHRTFRWDSESNEKAHVHVVVIGFYSENRTRDKRIYAGEHMVHADNINSYLFDAPNVLIRSRTKTLCKVPPMVYGNKPTDGGHLFLTEEERKEVLQKEPFIEKFIKQIYGAQEYINGIKRYCLWLVGANPSELSKSKFIMNRIEGVKEFRLASTKKATQESAATPTLFQEIRHPNSDYIIVPRHSSENRRYVPFGFVSPNILVNDAVQMIPEANIYHFGVLMSNVHMGWMRAVAGRIKSDYRYSKDIVYNNFPWPTPTESQKVAIEKTAQGILDARAKYPDSSLADLYNESLMPPELRKAHQANDRAVMQAYGFDVKTMTEASCVAELMRRYQELTAE